MSSSTSSSLPNRTVFCVKFQRELPGLDEPPFDNELGQRIYEHVSRDAWSMWVDHCKILLNEYRLNPANPQDQEFLAKQLEQFFFGEGAALPAEYVPPKKKQ
ncbi:MAG TPA: oxidative damage protection protein [Terriglobales bacterium]|nr:oxidative damage protection protein [Terriglobales bacterium]